MVERDVRRDVVLGIGLLWIAGAIWFATGWVDDGDNTCGSVLRAEVWWHRAWAPCRRTMVLRSALSVGGVLVGVGLVIAGLVAYPRTRLAVDATIVTASSALVAMLLANELVRSGGLWS